MKNIKYVILGLFIAFILVFILNIIVSFINSNRIIHVNKYDGYDKTIEVFNNKIDKIKNTDCKNSLKEMMNRINENNFNNDVSIKEYYESFYKDDKTFVDYYNDVSDACNVKDEKIYIKAMSVMSYPTQIKDEYNHSYELHIKYKNDETKDEIGTYTTILNELGVMSDILGELK